VTTFRLLTVCTGNVCRSAMAAILLRDRLAALSDVVVASAGTGAPVGMGMTYEGLHLMDRLGLGDLARAHRAQDLTRELIQTSDLILTAAQTHRRAVVQDVPAATGRTFTLNQFAHLAQYVGAEEWDWAAGELAPEASPLSAAVLAAGAARAVAPHLTGERLDIADPYMEPMPVYEACLAQVTQAVDAIAGLLLAAPAGQGAAAGHA
jgi:protein-tyrosine phosphatase